MPDRGSSTIRSALVLAAGLGTRMRPITDTMPKPLVRVGGRTLLDHALDRLVEAAIENAVVNVHYFPDQVEAHLRGRERPRIAISDERARLLETGGGAKKALPLLAGADGSAPFALLNSDSLWVDGPTSNMASLVETWAPERMDILLLAAPVATSVGYDGRGDFLMDADGRLRRRPERDVAPFVYAGAAILKPELFADTPDGPFSLNLLFDRAIALDRLYGMRLEGEWLHVGTPEAIPAAEARLSEHVTPRR
jgi:MurNAc alpha-1-phosphate uridylyltransferase